MRKCWKGSRRGGKESACQSRRHGFDPRPRKILHAVGRLSPAPQKPEPEHLGLRASTTDASVPKAGAPQQEKPWRSEAHTPQLESGPRSLRLEKSPGSREDPEQPKINKFFFKKRKGAGRGL